MGAVTLMIRQKFKRSLIWASQLENLAGVLAITAGIAAAAHFNDEAFVFVVGAVFAIALPKTAKIVHALAIGFLGLLFFYFLSGVKKTITGQPLFVFDLYYLRENVLILAINDWRVFVGLALVSCAVLAVAIVYFRAPLQRWTRSRLASLVITLLVCLIASAFVANAGKRSWRPTFAIFLESALAGGYNFIPPAKATELPGDLKAKPSGTGGEPNPLPHMVFVLQESTISPAQLTLAKPYKPERLFVNSRQSKTGTLSVSTFGGGTWLSLFSFVAQIHPDQLGRNGRYVTFQLTGRLKRTLFSVLKHKGYATSVIYSVPGTFINAEQFLLSNGLDRFDDPASLGISSGLDWRIPDHAFLDAALERLKSDRPQAIVVLTIDQHGPHDMLDPLTDYLARFAASDKAHGEFVDAAFEGTSRPIVIVTFGDHQPGFMSGIAAAPPWHETSYQIECHPAELCDYAMVPDQVDLTLLATYLFDAVGLQKDELMRIQKYLYADCVANTQRCGKEAKAGFNWYLSQSTLR
jgi:hypothetical protein